MSDVIATVWDFDKTLISGYMQDPIFKKYGVDGREFWKENDEEIEKLEKQGYTVNHDNFYLNRFVRMSKEKGIFEGLNNAGLKRFGVDLEFYPGAIDLFKEINALSEKPEYKQFGITFENYIVSTGFKKVIEGSEIAPCVKKIWGAEIADAADGKSLAEITYSIDNTTKTRAIFEINKGVGIVTGSTIDVNSKIKQEDRRVQFCNMVYVVDGPSDVPVFSLLGQKGGTSLAVYPKGDEKAYNQVCRLSEEGRVQMVAEADYRKDSGAYMWVMRRLKSQADMIVKEKKAAYCTGAGTPRHLV